MYRAISHFGALVSWISLGLCGCSDLTRGARPVDESAAVTQILMGEAQCSVFLNADRVVVIRPYGSVSEAISQKSTGFGALPLRIEHDDGINLLVFLKQQTQEILGWAEIPRRVIDFDYLRKSYAKFDVPSGNWSPMLIKASLKDSAAHDEIREQGNYGRD